MADEFPSSDKMITGSSAKQPFHFSGDGIYHNLTIFAQNMEEATKEWLEKRVSIAQSTPEEKGDTEHAVQ